MFGIGDFARLGRVSVRMLRHYDAIGLLRPAYVDPVTGYRSYRAGQLARLNRIVALKDLGFTLEQVRAILDEKVTAEELHGMVRLRRAELEARIAADTERLRGVEARLRAIEREGCMRTQEVVVKRIERVRVAELTGTVQDYTPEHVGPVVRGLYDRLYGLLRAAGITPVCGAICCYEPQDDGSVRIHAGMGVAVEPGAGQEFQVVDLPVVEQAATVVHQGSMEEVGATYQALAHWIEEHEYRPTGRVREVTIEAGPDPADWVTEIQMEVTGPARS